MIRERTNRSRRRSGHDDTGPVGDSPIQQLEQSNCGFYNEIEDRRKSNGSLLTKNPTTSGSSSKTRNSTRRDKQTSDEAEDDEGNSDNLTYTKEDSDTSRKDVESPLDAMRKVEDYLTKHEKREIEMSDDDEARRRKSRRSRRSRDLREEKIGGLASKTTDCAVYDEDERSIDGQNVESPDNDRAIVGKRRKWKKERTEKSRISLSKRTEDDEGYDEDAAMSIEKRESESPDNDSAMRKKRRKWKKQRRDKNRVTETNGTVEDDAYDDEVRGKSRKIRSNEPRISARRKKRRSKTDTSGRSKMRDEELPITEILRKAQVDSRNRYDETVSYPELTTDTIYVQRRNGFSAVKIPEGRSFADRRRSASRGSTVYPIKVAIVAQKIWNSVGLIHQGLLAGMALMHFLLIQHFFDLSMDFLVDYSLISEIYTNIFSFLATMSILSVFDKFDLAHLDFQHARDIYVDHSRSFLAVPLYVATFFLHQASLLVDDKMSLLNYGGNVTWFENNSTNITVEEQLITWQKVILAKDSLAVIAWLFVALGPSEDMLLTHLKTMEKYTDTPEPSSPQNRRNDDEN